MADVVLGDLYTLNRSLLAKKDPMEEQEIITNIANISAWFSSKYEQHYYMLLCRERFDFTVFHIVDSHYYEASQELRELIQERGELMSMNYDHENKYFEIWIRIGDNPEPYLYLLFDCDDWIIET